MNAQGFREQHRAYGVFIPAAEVEAYLAAGWRLVEDSCFERLDGALMRPPASAGQEAA